ncbi:MAG TPA: twitching motility protein PilT [Streptosporangiaceae bacterium]|nr:twitching motility protein PilT [Streptosporangiaceae bacterium]
MTQAYVYDSGVLIAADNNERRVWVRHKLALAEGRDVHVPAIVVGQAWRDGRRQVLLGQFLAGSSVDPVGLETAKAAGILCGRAGTADVVDATVAVMGAARGAVIWTSDPKDIQRLVDHTGARPGPVVRAVTARP